MTQDPVDIAAEILFKLRTEHRPIDELTPEVRPGSLEQAYDIQANLNARLVEAGFGAGVGAKIGCTTPVMQQYLKINHPCAGSLFAATVAEGVVTRPRRDFVRPGVECEIAVDITRDITDIDAPTPEAVAPYVASARASIEIVDDRWIDFAQVSTPTLIADNFFNAGCVLGPSVTVDPMNLDTVTGRMVINGQEVGNGTGADILGHPLAALAWLAQHRIARGDPLREGQVVTLGSLVQTVWIDRGDKVEIELPELGTCSLVIE
jgi:2-oxo-3-hexenedioate decarboxylase/2-keto-4-pentenoate hydratase